MAALTPSMGTIHGLWIMIVISAEMDGQRRLWLGTVLDCNGDGRLAMTEHEAGIEWVTGHGLKSGHGLRFGY